MTKALSIGDDVKVRDSDQTRELGTASRTGSVAGMSREPDVATGEIVAYAVMMDADKRVWMVDPAYLDLL